MARRWIPRSPRLPAAVAVASFACAAGAHHGTTVFDHDKPIVVNGVVREFRWTSPHAWIVVDVPAAAGAPSPAPPPDGGQWSFEGASIAVMVRHGWKSGSLRPGDHISVVAAPRRDGTRSGEFISVTLTDSGRVLQLADR